MRVSSVEDIISFASINRLSHWLVISWGFFFSESQRSMADTVLDRQLPPSTQEISTLDHNLGKTGAGGRHSVNASISMPVPETALQYLPSSTITEIHTSDHDSEKSEASDCEKASISIPVLETETLDIEHVPVQNDPRKWSSFRKVSFLTQVSVLSITSSFLTIHFFT